MDKQITLDEWLTTHRAKRVRKVKAATMAERLSDAMARRTRKPKRR